MNWKRRIGCIILLIPTLVVIGSCVSKKEYLTKVEKGEKLSSELVALKSENSRLIGERDALNKQLLALQGERNDLEKARAQLQLKNLSLEKEIAPVLRT